MTVLPTDIYLTTRFFTPDGGISPTEVAYQFQAQDYIDLPDDCQFLVVDQGISYRVSRTDLYTKTSYTSAYLLANRNGVAYRARLTEFIQAYAEIAPTIGSFLIGSVDSAIINPTYSITIQMTPESRPVSDKTFKFEINGDLVDFFVSSQIQSISRTSSTATFFVNDTTGFEVGDVIENDSRTGSGIITSIVNTSVTIDSPDPLRWSNGQRMYREQEQLGVTRFLLFDLSGNVLGWQAADPGFQPMNEPYQLFFGNNAAGKPLASLIETGSTLQGRMEATNLVGTDTAISPVVPIGVESRPPLFGDITFTELSSNAQQTTYRLSWTMLDRGLPEAVIEFYWPVFFSESIFSGETAEQARITAIKIQQETSTQVSPKCIASVKRSINHLLNKTLLRNEFRVLQVNEDETIYDSSGTQKAFVGVDKQTQVLSVNNAEQFNLPYYMTNVPTEMYSDTFVTDAINTSGNGINSEVDFNADAEYEFDIGFWQEVSARRQGVPVTTSFPSFTLAPGQFFCNSGAINETGASYSSSSFGITGAIWTRSNANGFLTWTPGVATGYSFEESFYGNSTGNPGWGYFVGQICQFQHGVCPGANSITCTTTCQSVKEGDLQIDPIPPLSSTNSNEEYRNRPNNAGFDQALLFDNTLLLDKTRFYTFEVGDTFTYASSDLMIGREPILTQTQGQATVSSFVDLQVTAEPTRYRLDYTEQDFDFVFNNSDLAVLGVDGTADFGFFLVATNPEGREIRFVKTTGIGTGGGGGGGTTSDKTLELEFADTRNFNDKFSGAEISAVTSSGSSTYYDSNGILVSTRTNFLLHSENFGNAVWVKSAGATVTDNFNIGPTGGTITAERLELAPGPTASLSQAVNVISGTHTFSIWIRATQSLSQYQLNISANGGAETFDTGTLLAGSSWSRVDLTASPGAAIDEVSISNGNGSYDTDILVWGAQLEQGNSVTDYISTTTSTGSSPRFDYTPDGSVSRGLLLEDETTNLALYATDFDNTIWQKDNLNVSANSGTTPAPDATSTADQLTATAANATISQQIVVPQTFAYLTFSVFLRGNASVEMSINGTDFEAQSIVSGEWTRCSVTQIVRNKLAIPTIRLTTNADTVFAWGAQVE